MPALEKSLRTKLENTVKVAREVAEAGARSSLEQIGVGDADAPKHLSEEEKNLRRRLRIHGRQLGDEPGEKKGTQTIERLVEEVAYEHWHRLLFASFLAENNLLMYPDPDEPVAVSIAECDDMAADEGARNGWELAAKYAAKMLPQIFRNESPVFEMELPPETQQELEKLVANLPKHVFTASDSLGWVYQFWQANRKDSINKSEVKIGARELPAVTQLFTEAYMVDFLLDNTLGAWHAAKSLMHHPQLITEARYEQDLRDAISLPGCSWGHLRFITSGSSKWWPATGGFELWPRNAREIKCLDPCMGSGHFVVAMFERLLALRVAEEKLEPREAAKLVIEENLFGLEIDPRCTQIAAFAVALAAWRRVGYCVLPPMNLACCGLAPNSAIEDWVALAGEDSRLQRGMEILYGLFERAPVLGSLIDPSAVKGDLLAANSNELRPLLEAAVSAEESDDAQHELAVTARGLATAADILSRQFTLVATNVPYLGRGKQHEVMMDYCECVLPDSRADLATCFVERSITFCSDAGVTALVTPQIWLFLDGYKALRAKLLDNATWLSVARLGPGAFETISGEVVNAALFVIEKKKPSLDCAMIAFDVSNCNSASAKAASLIQIEPCSVKQSHQRKNPDSRVTLADFVDTPLLGKLVSSTEGLSTGDGDRFVRHIWEIPSISSAWEFFQSAPDTSGVLQGCSEIVFWEGGDGVLSRFDGARIQGHAAWRKPGVLVGRMSRIRSSIYQQRLFDKSCVVLTARNPSELPAIYAYCCSNEFEEEIRKLDKKVGVATSVPLKVPFDMGRWQDVANKLYPLGLPKGISTNPTQWMFDGCPFNSDRPLQVAIARLVGYEWPRQTGSNFPDCPSLGSDELAGLADKDGIVCIPPVRGEASAADRLLNLLAKAYGAAWSSDELNRLLADAGYAGQSLEMWLRDGFFADHLEVFARRPFVWHVWDGLRDGFSALLNYHKLDHKNLETLIYTYLGDWISRCESEDKSKGLSDDGEKTAAAKNLKRKLELILEGQAPYDIFVRWKPLHQQPIGWNPDINDGVRINIRPFLSVPDVKAKGAGVLRVNPKIKWDKDRGKEPERSKRDYPWFWGWDQKTTDFNGGPEFKGERFNDCHYTLAAKQRARESSK
jgi:hypothetical protein